MSEQAAGTDEGQGNTDADGGNGEGEGTAFLDSIANEDLRGNELLSGFKDADSLAEDYVKLKSASPIIPEKAEDYTISDDHKDVFQDEEAVNGFRNVALDAGLTQAQYDTLLKFEAGRAADWLKTAQGAQTESKKALEDKFGDELGGKIKSAVRLLEATGSKELADRVDIDQDPALLGALIKISSLISEDKLETGGAGGGDPRPTHADGSARLKYESMGD